MESTSYLPPLAWYVLGCFLGIVLSMEIIVKLISRRKEKKLREEIERLKQESKDLSRKEMEMMD